jgi:hypothetical protein
VINEPLAFAHWHLGKIEWDAALRSGAIEVSGSRALARALPKWNRRGGAAADPAAVFGSPARRPGPAPANASA